MQVQQHIGALGLDIRALAGGVPQAVAHGILQQLRAINRVTDGFIAAAAIAGKRGARGEMLAPIHALDGLEQTLASCAASTEPTLNRTRVAVRDHRQAR